MPEAKDKSNEAVEEAQPAVVTKHAVLTEPTAEEKPETTDTDSSATKDPASPSATRIKIQPLSKPEDLKPEAKEETKESDPEDAIDDDEDDDSSGRNKLKDASRDEQDLIDRKAAERQANLDKIALAKTYYLPINQVVRRRSKHVAIVGAVLIILLGLAWLDVSLDAGLISIPGIKAPTHFFSK